MATEYMTWVPKKKRWQKFTKGKNYARSCKQLREDFPDLIHADTRGGSRAAANAWWRLKEAEIDDKANAPIREAEHDLNRLESVVKNTQRLVNEMWGDVPDDRKLRKFIDMWLEKQETRVHSGDIDASRFEAYRRCVENFGEFVGSDQSVDAVDTPTFDRYHTTLLQKVAAKKEGEKGWAPSYAKLHLDTAKQFAKYCVVIADIPLPRNLIDNRTLRIKVPKTRNKTLPVAKIKSILTDQRFGERMQLWWLLMLNCGMYPSDISDLEQSQIKGGQIIRKRSKGEVHDDVPTVAYKLWPKTLKLLLKQRSDHEQYALVNQDGLQLQRRYIEEGRGKRTCAIDSAFKRLKSKHKLTFTLSQLRKTSANLLFNEKRFRSLHTLFLGHSPKSTAEIYYVNPDDDTLDEALDWLGEQYGLVK